MKTVGIAELKARLSAKLAVVKRGESITVLDRKTPIAMIVPYRSETEPLQSRSAAGKVALGRIPLPRPLEVRGDIVKMLLDDRAVR